VGELLDVIDRVRVDAQIPFGANRFLGEHTRRIFNLLARDPRFARVPLHPAVLPLVEQVLDAQCLLSSLTAIEMHPGQAAQPLHCDDGYAATTPFGSVVSHGALNVAAATGLAYRCGLFEGWAFFTPDVTQPTPTWKSLASGWTDMHAMVEDPAYDGVTNKTVYVMDDGGLYRTTDIDNLDVPANFTRLDTGMTVTEIYSIAGHGGNPILGAQDVGPRVWKTDPGVGDNTKRWRFIGGNGCCSWIGDGMTAAASTSNPNVLYGSRQYLDMIRSTGGGATAVSIVKSSTLIDARSHGPEHQRKLPRALRPRSVELEPDVRRRPSIWRSTTWTAATRRRGRRSARRTSILRAAAIRPRASSPWRRRTRTSWVGYSCSGHVFKSMTRRR
jgi:hypothetical protein